MNIPLLEDGIQPIALDNWSKNEFCFDNCALYRFSSTAHIL